MGRLTETQILAKRTGTINQSMRPKIISDPLPRAARRTLMFTKQATAQSMKACELQIFHLLMQPF